MVIHNLMIIICHTVHKTLPKEPHLNMLLHHIQKLIEGFESIKFYHSLRGIHSLANKACNLSIGMFLTSTLLH